MTNKKQKEILKQTLSNGQLSIIDLIEKCDNLDNTNDIKEEHSNYRNNRNKEFQLLEETLINI